MLLKYSPEDGDPQEFPYKPRKLMSVEAELLEECGGSSWDTYDEFIIRLSVDQLKAKRALLWVMLKRQDPKLRFVDVVIRADEVSIDYDADEEAEFRARIEADESLSVEDKQAALALAGLVLVEPAESEAEPEAEPEGKDEPGDGDTASL